jgi:hypothetical protein
VFGSAHLEELGRVLMAISRSMPRRAETEKQMTAVEKLEANAIRPLLALIPEPVK